MSYVYGRQRPAEADPLSSLTPDQRRYLSAVEFAKKRLAHGYQGEQLKLEELGVSVDQEYGRLDNLAQDYLKEKDRWGITRLFHKLTFRSPERRIKRELNAIDLGRLLEKPSKKGGLSALVEAPAEAILFGLFLFSLVLMLSGSGITGYTGYTIASLPVIVNWPFIFGLMIFILDLIAIERFYSK